MRRFDLGGKRVTPGFNDAHSHPCSAGVALVTQVALEMDSIEAITAAIRAKAAATPRGDWVVGFLYGDTKTPRPLVRADLDAAAPDHPVIVQHRGGHTAFVNSRALALAGEQPTPIQRTVSASVTPADSGITEEWRRTPQGVSLGVKAPSRDDYPTLISKQFAGRRITSPAKRCIRPPSGVPGCARCWWLLGRFIRTWLFGTRQDDRRRSAYGFGDSGYGSVAPACRRIISERTALCPGLRWPGDYRGISRATRETLYEQARKAYLAGWQVGTGAAMWR